MSETRLISVIGRKNSGKTTLVVALAAEHIKRGRKVSTIKHGTHPTVLDAEGTDTWRHFNEGGAHQVLIESPGQRTLFERTEAESDPVSLARTYMSDADLVIIEGFKKHRVPKIEVYRSDNREGLVLGTDGTHAEDWVAVLTDVRPLEAPCPVFTLTDTSWLVTLASLTWDKAMIVGA